MPPPGDDDTSPSDDDTSPTDDDTSPTDDDTVTDDDTTPSDDDTTPSDDDTTPSDDDTTPSDDDTTPSDDDTTPSDDDTTPSDDDTTPSDDDTTPSDDDTTPSDDDTTPVDDDADDDSTGQAPGVVINSPINGHTYNTYIIDIDVDLTRVTDASTVKVLLDDVDITTLLTVTATFVTGSLNAGNGGDHVLRVEASNEYGAGAAESAFKINKPWIEVDLPQQGDYYNSSTMDVKAFYGNCLDGGVTVTLDGADITGQLDVFLGKITGKLEMLTTGDHMMVFTAQRGADIAEVDVPFTVELLDPHFDFHASATQLATGQYVDLFYTFYDESGNDITSSVAIDIIVSPNTGVVQVGDRLWFYYPGLFSITVSTYYSGQTYSATVWLYVTQADIYSLDIQASPNEITAGQTVLMTATIVDINGNPVYLPVAYTVDPPFGATVNDNAITLTHAGEATVIGNVVGYDVYDTATVTVNPGPPTDVTLYVDQPTINQHDSVQAVVDAQDAYGNATPNNTFVEVVPTTGVTITPGATHHYTIKFDSPGYFVVSGKVNGYPALVDQQVVQVVNITVPGVMFTSPPRGFYTHDPTVQVSGYVSNVDTYTATLTINDEYVYIRPVDGYFETTFTLASGLNIIVAKVKDINGKTAEGSTSVLYGKAEWPNDSWITDAFGLRITNVGFTDVEAVIERFLIDLDIEQMLLSMNPIFDEKVEIWGVTVASAKAWIKGADYSFPWVHFNCEPGGMNVIAGINTFTLWFDVRVYVIGIGSTIHGQVILTDTQGSAWAWITAQNGKLQLTMDALTLTIGSMDVQLSGFPQILLDLFEGVITSVVESVVSTALQQMIPPLVQGFLDQIPYDFQFPVGNANFTFAANPAAVLFDGDGGTINLSSRTLTDTINPVMPVFNGSLKTDNPMPAMGHYIPGGQEEIHFGFVLGDDIINQILYQVFRSGMLAPDFPNVFTACSEPLHTLLPQICTTYGDVPITIKLRPLLPPIMMLGSAAADSTSSVPAQIQLGDMLIYLYAETTGGEEPVLTLATSVTLPATISHDYATNTLTVAFGTPTVVVDTVNNPLDLNEALFESLVPPLVQLLLPLLSQAIGGFQLPTFDGWVPQLQQMMIMGSGLDFIGIFLRLDPAP